MRCLSLVNKLVGTWLASGLIVSSQAIGAQILQIDGAKPYCGSSKTLLLKGSIEQGDADALIENLEKASVKKGDKHGVSGWISLSSNGGNLSEALKIADIIRNRNIGTRVDQGEICQSACAIVFMAGSSKASDGSILPMRRLDVNAHLGFHAPNLREKDYAALSVAGAAGARVVERTMIAAASEFARIMREHDWKPSLTQAALARTGGDFEVVDTVDEAGRWGIELQHESRLRVPGARGWSEKPVWTLGAAAWCLNTLAWDFDSSAMDAVKHGFDEDRGVAKAVDPWIKSSRAELSQSRVAKIPVFPTKLGESYKRTLLVYSSVTGFGHPNDMAGVICPLETDHAGRIVLTNQWHSQRRPIDRIRAWHALPPDTKLTDVDRGINASEIFESDISQNGDKGLVLQRQIQSWDHNGSGMQTWEDQLADGTLRLRIAYTKPKKRFDPKLIPPGTILFDGIRQGDRIVGNAHRFRKACRKPLAYKVEGKYNENADSFTLRGAAPDLALGTCRVQGKRRDIGAARLEFTLIKPSFSDAEPEERKVTISCPL